MESTSPTQTYTLDEVASLSGLNPRTVRYYIQLELVDPPVGQTRAARYTWQHLGRLLEIRKLTEQGFSLERVRELLVEGSAVPSTAQIRRTGDIEVKSHVHLADGLELVIEPGRAHLTPEKLRRLAREILAAHARVLQEQQE